MTHTHSRGFSNDFNVLMIALTIPETVASGERNLSRLKLIEKYLHTLMTQLTAFSSASDELS